MLNFIFYLAIAALGCLVVIAILWILIKILVNAFQIILIALIVLIIIYWLLHRK